MRRHPSARLRGGLISLLISLQLLGLDILVRASVKQMLRELAAPPSTLSLGLHVALDVLLLVSLWLYYDSIDDRGFTCFCQSRNERPLWDTPAHETALLTTVLTATPILSFPLFDLLSAGPIPRVAAALLAPAGSLTVTVGGRMLILARLRSLWAGQRELCTGKEKPVHPVTRILYAAVFFLSLGLALWVGIGMFAPQLIVIGGLIPALPSWLVGAVCMLLLTGWSIHAATAVLARHRLLTRLRGMAARGQITYTAEGHLYLSVLFPCLYAGLTVVHHGKMGNLERQTVYRVGMVHGKKRRSILILCPNQVYRFLHRLPGQGLIFGARFGGRAFYKPLYAWFENHAFDFPEGEGERILLVAPFPAVVGVQDELTEWFLALDNGSRAFGYTVYSPIAFLHTLERT